MRYAQALLPAYTVRLAQHRVVLHFGMHWGPLIGSRTSALARQRAAAARATHYVYCGGYSVALGIARLPRSPRGWRQLSAAAVFAMRHASGAVAWLVALDETVHWVVAVRDGAVMARSDRIYPSREAAQEALTQLMADVPGLRVIDAVHLDSDPTRADASRPPADLPANPLAASPSDSQGLPYAVVMLAEWFDRALPIQTLGWHRRVTPLGWGLVLTALCLGVWLIKARMQSPTLPMPSVASSEPLDAQQLLRERARRRQEAINANWGGAESFSTVAHSFRQLPVHVAGWRITGSQCTWRSAAWQCRADYERDHPGATNADLAAVISSDFEYRFTPLAFAHLIWQVPTPAAQLDVDTLVHGMWLDSVLFAHLQAKGAAFSHITLGPPTPLDESADIQQADSSMLMPRLRNLTRRSIDIQGPLRSFGLLSSIERHIAWESVALRLRWGETPSLAQSAIHLVARGWIHEQANDE